MNAENIIWKKTRQMLILHLPLLYPFARFVIYKIHIVWSIINFLINLDFIFWCMRFLLDQSFVKNIYISLIIIFFYFIISSLLVYLWNCDKLSFISWTVSFQIFCVLSCTKIVMSFFQSKDALDNRAFVHMPSTQN